MPSLIKGLYSYLVIQTLSHFIFVEGHDSERFKKTNNCFYFLLGSVIESFVNHRYVNTINDECSSDVWLSISAGSGLMSECMENRESDVLLECPETSQETKDLPAFGESEPKVVCQQCGQDFSQLEVFLCSTCLRWPKKVVNTLNKNFLLLIEIFHKKNNLNEKWFSEPNVCDFERTGEVGTQVLCSDHAIGFLWRNHFWQLKLLFKFKFFTF